MIGSSLLHCEDDKAKFANVAQRNTDQYDIQNETINIQKLRLSIILSEIGLDLLKRLLLVVVLMVVVLLSRGVRVRSVPSRVTILMR